MSKYSLQRRPKDVVWLDICLLSYVDLEVFLPNPLIKVTNKGRLGGVHKFYAKRVDVVNLGAKQRNLESFTRFMLILFKIGI